MYELRKLSEDTVAFHQTLLDAFLLAKNPAATPRDPSHLVRYQP